MVEKIIKNCGKTKKKLLKLPKMNSQLKRLLALTYNSGTCPITWAWSRLTRLQVCTCACMQMRQRCNLTRRCNLQRDESVDTCGGNCRHNLKKNEKKESEREREVLSRISSRSPLVPQGASESTENNDVIHRVLIRA